ncbi:MAG: NUDIX hydrolase [Opitutaceae bacterium]|nr:NUDIX hydrolase [Opitutaceae bacterium]
MAEDPPRPHRWQRLRTVPHASTRIFDVTRAVYRHPRRDREQDFFVIAAPDWVNVIALTPQRHLVLVRQFRYGIDAFSLEVPGGVIDGGEDPVAAGQRELREESGYTGGPARLLGSVHPNPAIQNNRCHLVLVENAVPAAELDWDPDEEFEILTRPVDEVYAMAARGEITHALVLDALLLFLPHWQRLKGGTV